MLIKIFDLLSKLEKKNFYLLLILILLMAFLDVLGVASIVPFITVLASPELIETNLILNFLYRFSKSNLNISSIIDFQFLLGIVVFFLLITSLLVRAITQYAQIRFSLMREYTIGKRFIENYLKQPYEWFLQRNSSDLAKTVLSEVGNVVNQTVLSIILVISHSIVALSLLILLILSNPTISLIIGLVLIVSYVGIYFVIKKFLFRIGNERIKSNELRYMAVSEAFNAFKEMKFGRLENVYLRRFENSAKVYANTQSLAQAITQVPRYFIELIAFGGMIVIVLYLMKEGNGIVDALPIITLYAFAGYRLIPSFQQIFYSYSQIRFSKAALDSLHKDFFSLNLDNTNKKHQNLSFSKSIKFKNIFYNYSKNDRKILKNLNFEIVADTKVGIIGPTGSGKTTILDIILGLLNPTSGEVFVDGKIINSENVRSWQKNIGYVSQKIFLSDDTLAANIAFGIEKNKIDINKVINASKIANFHDFVNTNLKDKYNTMIGENGVRLSGGQHQRICIARAIYNNPKILILDEATSALDNLTEKVVMDAMDNLQNKITIILVSHRMNIIKNCDKIILLEEGEIKSQDTFNNLMQENKYFKKLSLS